VVGRDPDVEVQLDSSTVSRHHARITLTADAAVLEDLGSKNGTSHKNDRVTSPVRLADGDAIRIGSVLVTFHRRDYEGSTETQRSAFQE
jgi:pSer/pThr/pTyr-binding forkhead associated (FHA) protein